MSLLTALAGLLHMPAPATAQRQLIERAANSIDPLLKTVGGYERKLAPVIEQAVAYCERLIEEIPGPLDINARAFANDPLIHALFGSVDDIAAMIGTSEAVRSFMGIGHHAIDAEFFALLGMRRYEKKVSGMALQDGFIRNDVPQKLLYFGDHTLSSVSADRDAARGGLREAAFDSLVASFAAQVKEWREARQDLRVAVEVARSRKQERTELEQRLRLAGEALAPHRLLQAFADWLADPQPHLHLVPTSVCVDRMGVIFDGGSANTGAATLDFPELVGRDRRHWLVLLARIRREEAEEAMARQEKAHRYIII